MQLYLYLTRSQSMTRQTGKCGVYKEDVPRTTYSSEPSARKGSSNTARGQLGDCAGGVHLMGYGGNPARCRKANSYYISRAM